MRYLMAYSIPVLALIGFYLGGYWVLTGLLYAFVILPIAELFTGENTTNYSETEINSRLKNRFFDWMLYGNIFWVFGLSYWVFHQISTTNWSTWESVGAVLSLGVVLGANGINVAHELGHRDRLTERLMGKLLLLPSLYMHFHIEHNYGHHVWVSTPDDPSTGKYNQNVYAFWWQTVTGTYRKAWALQKRLNESENRAWWHVKNDMFWYQIIQLSYLLLLGMLFGWSIIPWVLAAAVIGFLLLETINYIEHYGLARAQLASGRYERVSKIHSWNSNHQLGRIVLYELTRHSDHHYKANKKYQILEHYDESPQLPYGYPSCMLLSLCPPLWFKLMNPRVPEKMQPQQQAVGIAG